MASISPTLLRIKDELHRFLPDEAILVACRAAGHRWRHRRFDPVVTLHLFILQILCFNTAMTHLRHLSKMPVKAAAYCKARMRLPLAVLQQLLRSSAEAMRPGGVHQRRTFLVDGTSTITPDMPELQRAFGQPKACRKGCGFPVPKILALLDAVSGMVVEAMGFALYTHEQSKVWLLHPLLAAGDVLVGDRGFCSFVHLAMLQIRGVDGLFRMHQRQIASFRPHRKHRRGRNKKYRKGMPSSRFVQRLGKYDQIVEWTRQHRPRWMSPEQFKALPSTLRVRELRYWLPRKGQRTLCVTIVTTLLDPVQYPKEEIARLYNLRWTAETHFAELKTTLKMRRLKCKTEAGIRKELAVYFLVYNLIHAVMLEAASRQKVEVSRISFIDAARWLLWAQPGEELKELVANPFRPDRHEPRVIKDRQDTYTKMLHPRSVLRKTLLKQAKGA